LPAWVRWKISHEHGFGLCHESALG